MAIDSILEFIIIFVSTMLGIVGIIFFDVLIIKDFKHVGIKKDKKRIVI